MPKLGTKQRNVIFQGRQANNNNINATFNESIINKWIYELYKEKTEIVEDKSTSRFQMYVCLGKYSSVTKYQINVTNLTTTANIFSQKCHKVLMRDFLSTIFY